MKSLFEHRLNRVERQIQIVSWIINLSFIGIGLLLAWAICLCEHMIEAIPEPSEQLANARLIAAAPELLYALKDLNGYLNAVANQLPVSELGAVLAKINGSCDVIAKATGK